MAGEHRYLWTRDQTLARLADGWRPQVWRPSLGQWVDHDFNFTTEATEVTVQEALAKMEASPDGPGTSGVNPFDESADPDYAEVPPQAELDAAGKDWLESTHFMDRKSGNMIDPPQTAPVIPGDEDDDF